MNKSKNVLPINCNCSKSKSRHINRSSLKQKLQNLNTLLNQIWENIMVCLDSLIKSQLKVILDSEFELEKF